jgi:hypothetical protein
MILRRLATVAALSVSTLLLGCGPAPYEIEPSTPANVTPSSARTPPPDPEPQGYQGQDEDRGVYLGAEEEDLYADTDPVALTEFRGTLEPYGAWVEDDVYGTVWVPSSAVVGANFVPYVSAGHWAYGDEWVWVSDYEWGWVPFHYGRWVWIGGRGWAWIPGRRYSGAWVSWRYGDGYLGWAPLAPTWYWHGGYAVAIGVVPVMPYVFCPYERVFYPQVAAHIVVGPQTPMIASRTRPWYPAQPAVGRTLASPRVNGPSPGEIGIRGSATPVPSDRGILRAQQFARPSTAVGAGARPPSIAPAPRGALLSQRATMGAPSLSAYRPSPGATYGAVRSQTGVPIGQQPPAFTRAPVATQPSPVPGYARPGFSSQLPSAFSRPTPSQPSFSRLAPPVSSTPSFSRPSFQSTPSFSRPSFQSTPSFSRPTPSVPSTPSFSRPSFQSTPSFSRPSFQSTPSFSRPSVSSPSFSSPSLGGGGGRSFARPR